MKRNTKGVGMKKWVIIGALAVLMAVGFVYPNPLGAAGRKIEINLPTTATGIGSTDTLSLAFVSRIFTLEPVKTKSGYFLSIYFRDTVKAAAAADTVGFVLVRRPDGAGDLDTAFTTAAASNPNGWITVYTFVEQLTHASSFPISKHIPEDSLAVYPIGPGVYAWMVYGGEKTASHVMDKAYKFTAFVEYEKAF